MPTQKDQVTDVKGNRRVKPKYVQQRTLQYKTFLKRAIAEAMQAAFNGHPDAQLAKTKIGVEYATDMESFPQIIVKFYEKKIDNAGVGHMEWGPSPNDPLYPDGPFTKFVPYRHRIYKGDIEFEIWAKTIVDRDKMADALIEILAMGEVSPMGKNFTDRLYGVMSSTPYGEFHYVTLNTDEINGYGEQAGLVPWMAEDTWSYQTSYRIPLLGEFYSLTPVEHNGEGYIDEVDFYPYDEADPEDTRPEDFPEGEIPDDAYIKVT